MKNKWILSHCDLDLWPNVTNSNRVWASVLSKRLAKTASKSVHPFGWNFVHKKNWTHTHTDTHTDKLQWKYNPSTISWRCKKKKKKQYPFDPIQASCVAQRGNGKALPYPMSLPGSQGVSMPSCMPIGPKLWVLEGYRQVTKQTNKQCSVRS